MEVDRNGLEVLDRDECLRLLDGATLGRVGVTAAALPSVLPVNFRLAGDRIVFRTGRGTKLAAATRNAVVAFEVDDIDPVRHTGWSVVVTGVARPVIDAGELAVLQERDIPRWAAGDDGHVVEVSIELVSGRRIPPGLPQG
jgi:nitroimidazol reductase NimA-like FMN-containing flavoprotein (pyridoxamine 5'-phosphate oxidase superfamily)